MQGENVTYKVEEELLSIEKIAALNFKRWNDALQTRNPEAVAELYTNDASFLPTVSGEFKFGQEEAAGYFEHFLQKFPYGKVMDEKVQITGPNSYLHSGMYNFELGPENERQTVEARFSFVWYRFPNGLWKIAHHHSSVKPASH